MSSSIQHPTSDKLKIIAVIPARYQASRFPAKLMQILGDKNIFFKFLILFFLFFVLLSCKRNNDYVLYNKENFCDSVILKHKYFNRYNFIVKEKIFNAKITKKNDSVKIIDFDYRYPYNRILIINDEYAILSGVINNYVVNNNNTIKPLTDSKWILIKSCNYNFRFIKEFYFSEKDDGFYFDNLVGINNFYRYKTKDKINYALYFDKITSNEVKGLSKIIINKDFKSFDIKMISNNVLKVIYYGNEINNKISKIGIETNKNSIELYYYKSISYNK